MACYILPLEKPPLTSLSPIHHPIPKFYILNGMGLRLVNGISPFQLFQEVEHNMRMPSLNPSYFFKENILPLVTFCFDCACVRVVVELEQ